MPLRPVAPPPGVTTPCGAGSVRVRLMVGPSASALNRQPTEIGLDSLPLVRVSDRPAAVEVAPHAEHVRARPTRAAEGTGECVEVPSAGSMGQRTRTAQGLCATPGAPVRGARGRIPAMNAVDPSDSRDAPEILRMLHPRPVRSSRQRRRLPTALDRHARPPGGGRNSA